MSKLDTKSIIMSRRARFMAAAIAGLSTGAVTGCDCNPLRPCLSIAPPDTDAAPGADAGAKVAPEAAAPPASVCLEFVPPEREAR